MTLPVTIRNNEVPEPQNSVRQHSVQIDSGGASSGAVGPHSAEKTRQQLPFLDRKLLESNVPCQTTFCSSSLSNLKECAFKRAASEVLFSSFCILTVVHHCTMCVRMQLKSNFCRMRFDSMRASFFTWLRHPETPLVTEARAFSSRAHLTCDCFIPLATKKKQRTLLEKACLATSLKIMGV